MSVEGLQDDCRDAAIERASEESRHDMVVDRGAVVELVQLVLEGCEQWPILAATRQLRADPSPERRLALEEKLPLQSSFHQGKRALDAVRLDIPRVSKRIVERRDGDGLRP